MMVPGHASLLCLCVSAIMLGVLSSMVVCSLGLWLGVAMSSPFSLLVVVSGQL